MSDYVTLQALQLQPHHEPTGRASHYRGEQTLPVPSSLRIVQFEGEKGFYLLYLDGAGNELTDTFHDTLEGALAQAEWEFGAQSSEWAVTRKP